MYTVLRSSVFDTWLSNLKDVKGKAKIIARLRQAGNGNFGDWGPVGDGVFEMREHHGPGYRIYYIRNGVAVYVVLCGGLKKSQSRDIATAKRMAKELKNGDPEWPAKPPKPPKPPSLRLSPTRRSTRRTTSTTKK